MTALGRMYAANFAAAASAAIDLFEINAPSDASVVIHSIMVGNYTDFGDAEAELLSWEILRGNTTSGSGGGAVTPQALESGGAAFGGTAEVLNTTLAGGGTQVHRDSFNVASGIQYRPTPEERIVLSPSGRLTVRLPVAPSDSITFAGTIYFEELGG